MRSLENHRVLDWVPARVTPLEILLVDDDAEFAALTAAWLREDGHRVSIARDGASAIVLARDLRPEVVLLDLGLPDGDGHEVARALRRDLPGTTPIIVVTGLREASLALAEDVDLMLNKPIPLELFGGLIEYMRRRRLHAVTDRPSR